MCYCLCVCVCVGACVCVLREKQLIIEFNRRNTVYPERHKVREIQKERERETRAWGK